MLLFEKSREGRGCAILPECDVPVVLPQEKDARKQPLHMPALSEPELSRHYTELAHKTRGVNDGFYPLGSCTMKYNPRVNEQIAALEGFNQDPSAAAAGHCAGMHGSHGSGRKIPL